MLEEPSTTCSEIAYRLGEDKGRVQRALQSLRRLEYVERILWVKRLDGRVVSHRIKWMPKIYVHGSLENLVKLGRLLSQRYLIDFVERSVEPGSPPETVLEIKVPFGAKKRLANLILDLGNHQLFKVHNVDLPSMQEFLYQYELHLLKIVLNNGFSFSHL